MAKDKDTKLKAKKDGVKKSKKIARAPVKTPGLSEERIEDSDSEGEASVKASVTKTPKVKEKTKSKTKSKPEPTPPPPPPKNESSSDESSDEQETDDDEDMPDTPTTLKKPDGVPVKVNGVKRKADDNSGSEEDSSDEQESDTPAEPETKRAKTSSSEDKTSSESSDEESSDEPTKDTSKAAAKQKPRTAPAAAPAAPSLPIVAREAVPTKPFQPPHGHVAIDVRSCIFSSGSFAGKQAWAITAPAGLPLQSIKDISLGGIKSGTPVINYKDVDYTLVEDTNHERQFDNVVLPSKGAFEQVPSKITRHLQILQKVTLPNLSKRQADTSIGSSAAGDIARPAESSARPQPKGLRMRFKPPGFGAGNPGLGSDSEEEEEEAATSNSKSFQFPKVLRVHGASDKPDDEGSIKKNKKKRKSEDVEMTNGDSGNGAQLAKSVSKDSVASSKEGLSKEERRKRKEEKRARKEAKAKAKGVS